MLTAAAIHQQVRRQLLARDSTPNAYRIMLEGLLGHTSAGILISTAEHVGFFNRRGHISFLLPQLCMSSSTNDEPLLLLLCTAAIPLSNSSYPRGLLLPSEDGTARINFFPNREKDRSPLFLNPIRNVNSASESQLERVAPWLLRELERSAEENSYAEQLVRCMETMACRWLEGTSAPRLSVRVSERIEVSFLTKLLEQKDPILDCLLFQRSYRQTVLGEIETSSDREEALASWFSCNHDGRLIPLVEESPNVLQARDQFFENDRETVLANIKSGRLWPRPVLSMLLLSYLPNLPVNGGPNQRMYYLRLIDALNVVLGISRSEELNVQGYFLGEFDYDSMPIWDDGSCLPRFGTGVALASRPMRPELLNLKYHDRT